MMKLSHHTVAAFLGTVILTAAHSAAQVVGTGGTAPDPQGVLWKDPGAIAQRDLFWGAGSQHRAPRGPFAFVEEDSGGTQPKIVVKDAGGQRWEVKFGAEVKPEIAANRFVWAFGYPTEEMYYVQTGVVTGVKGAGRASGHLSPEGNFLSARFRRRDAQLVRTDDQWTLRENPFIGQKELSGFMILMTMINNWDIGGTRNTRVLRATLPDGRAERWFAVTDLGAAFGRMGGAISSRSKWNLADYRQEGFIEKVEGNVLHLDYDGAESGVDQVPLEHAKWFVSLASQLTPQQVRRAFEAAGATPEEIDGFSKRFLEKIAELKAAVAR